ncbi:MAG: exodeoxyribonuclease VII large subunit [Burkholderiaceae bacterium]
MIERGAEPASSSVRSVAELVHGIADTLAARFGACAVRGELSGFSRAASGHCYFNLKDADGGSALLRCAMFRRSASLLAFAPADGQLVELRGRVGVYEPRGELQFVAEAMQRAGAGALYEQFLQTKARLQALGLFDPARKRRLPAYPRAVGVVTSLAAAALRDVLTCLARRAPQVRIIVYPSTVQGVDAPAGLVAAIGLASERGEVDALIVCRGGGSLEDLWAFNDERVVRAVVGASMPVVCGVGHETDVTLSDFAADLRAPTPTAAAELVAPTRADCLDVLAARALSMRRGVHATLDGHAQRLDRTASRLSRPGQGIRQQAQRLALLAQRLAQHVPRALESRRQDLARSESELRRRVAQRFVVEDQRLDGFATRLRALDPKQVLARGYAWLSDENGRAVISARDLAVGATLQAVLGDGSASVQVREVRFEPPD